MEGLETQKGPSRSEREKVLLCGGVFEHFLNLRLDVFAFTQLTSGLVIIVNIESQVICAEGILNINKISIHFNTSLSKTTRSIMDLLP